MTSSSGLKVHGQKGLRSKTRPDEKIYFAMKTPGRCQHLEHDFFVWKKVKSIKIRICWYRNITPPKKHHPKKKSPFFGFFPKIPLLNLNNPQPTNERYDNTKKKKKKNDTTKPTSSFVVFITFQRHLYQGQTLIETSLHLILPALSLPSRRLVKNGGFSGPLSSFREVDVFGSKNMRLQRCWINMFLKKGGG